MRLSPRFYRQIARRSRCNFSNELFISTGAERPAVCLCGHELQVSPLRGTMKPSRSGRNDRCWGASICRYGLAGSYQPPNGSSTRSWSSPSSRPYRRRWCPWPSRSRCSCPRCCRELHRRHWTRCHWTSCIRRPPADRRPAERRPPANRRRACCERVPCKASAHTAEQLPSAPSR
jgi:hypothetical protein